MECQCGDIIMVGVGVGVIDLRTAQVYWDAIFLVSQEVYLNFHHFFVGKIVGGVGGEGIYRN